MAKTKRSYICRECGSTSTSWLGRCPNCNAWESYEEEVITRASNGTSKRGARSKSERAVARTLEEVVIGETPRRSTGIGELDRVLGGGVMPGSLILVGGDPGIGKSTIMLQMCDAPGDAKFLYITGEESPGQVKLRADRLGVKAPGLRLIAETNLELIEPLIESQSPSVVIVDSIQTTYDPDIDSAPGSVVQVRECTAKLMQLAKRSGISLFVVGHVTKEGSIAGPKVLEHMVDTVLQFEGDRSGIYRILRTTKNRFGSTNELGVFEMTERGLQEVSNPSELFLSDRNEQSSGTAVAATIEGTRPLLLETQALVTPTSYNVPQRSATGFDYKRLQMLLAVLEKRLGLRLSQHDVFVNIVGGVRVDDPAVDLAVAAAIVSSLQDVACDPATALIGEVGLGGEMRPVAQPETRIREAAKLGFTNIVLPASNAAKLGSPEGANLTGVATVSEGIRAALAG